jgi:signal transduction histidine kinase
VISGAPSGAPPDPTELEIALDATVPAISPAVTATSTAVAAGLAAIAAAVTATGVYAAVCAFASRLPGVRAVTILRPDDDGLVKTGYLPVGSRLAPKVRSLAAAALHQRWIAAHAPGAPAHGFGPFNVDGHPDLLIVPFVQDDALLGALVIAGKENSLVAASKAERVMAAAFGVVAAQALRAVTLRQRLEVAISRTEHETKLAEERKRISHRLHDGPTQELALAGITLDRLASGLGANKEATQDAELARDLIDRAILGMRTILTTLREPDSKTPSVTGPLREVLAEIELDQAPNSPELEVDFSEVSGVQLTPEVERALVGIVREALHNVRKHANAESIQLEVRRLEHGVEVAVVDDGVGFDGMGQAGHFGLEQIRELAEGTGGRVDIGSLPGIGTSIRAWIPLPGGDGDGDGSPGWAKGLESTLDWPDGTEARAAPAEPDEAKGGTPPVESSG